MTPIRTIVREAWPSRLLLVLATLILSTVIGLGTQDESPGRLLIGLGVLPAFAAMLGAALGQGEHARWAWVLARPVSRGRWCLTHVMLDVLTILLAHRIAWWILPSTVTEVGMRWVEPEILSLPIAALVYVVTALGSLRGQNAVRGLLSQTPRLLAVGLGVYALQVCADELIIDRLHYAVLPVSEGAVAWRVAAIASRFVAPALASIGAAVHLLVWALASLPQPVPRRRAARVSIASAVSLGVTSSIAFSPAVLWIGGPTVYERGDARITVVAERADLFGEVRLEDPWGFARRTYGDPIADPDFDEVEPGEYRVCHTEELARVEGPRHVQYGALRTCADVRVAPGETVVVPTSAFDQPVFTAARLSAWFLYPGIASTLDAR